MVAALATVVPRMLTSTPSAVVVTNSADAPPEGIVESTTVDASWPRSNAHGTVTRRSRAVWATSGAVTDVAGWPCGQVIDAVRSWTGKKGTAIAAIRATRPAMVAVSAVARDRDGEAGERSDGECESADTTTYVSRRTCERGEGHFRAD